MGLGSIAEIFYIFKVSEAVVRFTASCRHLLTECPPKADAHARGLSVTTDLEKL